MQGHDITSHEPCSFYIGTECGTMFYIITSSHFATLTIYAHKREEKHG